MVSLQREDQKDQHWERKKRSDGRRGLCQPRSCRGKDGQCSGAGCGGTAPSGTGTPAAETAGSPFLSARLIQQQLCCERGLPGIQCRPGASFPTQRDC